MCYEIELVRVVAVLAQREEMNLKPRTQSGAVAALTILPLAGAVAATLRAWLIPEALAALKNAMDGVPVKGYLHWSLLDNFEWISGYKHYYGLFALDRTTFQRTPKSSAAVRERLLAPMACRELERSPA